MFNAQSRLLCMADLKVFTPRLVYCTAMSAKSDMLLDLVGLPSYCLQVKSQYLAMISYRVCASIMSHERLVIK